MTLLDRLLSLRRPPPGFVVSHSACGRVVRRTDVDPRAADLLMARFAAGDPALRALKRDVKASVHDGLDLEGRPVCLKAYRSRRRGWRGLVHLALLRSRGVPVPEPFLLWTRPPGSGGGAVVAMEDLSPLPQLDRWVSRRLEEAGPAARSELRAVAAALGAAVRDLHARGIYLDDLKTCNVFIEPGAPPAFRFVDVDGARPAGTVGARRRARTLAQLNRSIPVGAGLGARRAFWAEYRRGLPPATARAVRRAAMERSGRRPVLYVSEDGVRREAWPERATAWPR